MLNHLIQRISHYLFIFSICITLAACSSSDGPPSYSVNVNNIPNPKVVPLAKSKYGNPSSYVVRGKRYHVLPSASGYNKRGIASWYGTKFHGRLTSTREPYNLYSMTAASPELPLPCFVRVTNLENGKHIIVKVNDRGPFAPNRIIDLSYVAAKKLGMLKRGTANVQVTALTSSQQSAPTASPSYLLRKFTKNESPILSNSTKGIYLQLGAFSDYANANKLRIQTASRTNRPVKVYTIKRNGDNLYQVKVGPLNSVSQLEQIKRQLGNQS